jgi:hypothetical protein
VNGLIDVDFPIAKVYPFIVGGVGHYEFRHFSPGNDSQGWGVIAGVGMKFRIHQDLRSRIEARYVDMSVLSNNDDEDARYIGLLWGLDINF